MSLTDAAVTHSAGGERGASHAFARNTPADLIKCLGDWRSECYQQYLKDDLALRLSVTGGSLLQYLYQLVLLLLFYQALLALYYFFRLLF